MLSIGKIKKKINLDKIINRIRIENDEVAWVGIKMKGTNVRVEIIKADEIPNIVKENEYCNIVATKDSMVEKISAQNGTPIVKEGDVVKKGSILISGTMDGKYTGTQNVHAIGCVIGKVWYKEKIRMYYKQNKRRD